MIGDAERFRDLSREFSQLEPVANALNAEARARRDLAAAEAIIDLQTARYVEALQASTRHAPLKRLRAHGNHSRTVALEKARAQLAAGRDPNEVLDLLAHTLVNRLLHAPTVALREAALTGDGDLARAADKLFPPLPEGDAASNDDDADA